MRATPLWLLGCIFASAPFLVYGVSTINWTFYAPGAGGKIEGKFEAASKDASGNAAIHTLDDVRSGASRYVTLSSASKDRATSTPTSARSPMRAHKIGRCTHSPMWLDMFTIPVARSTAIVHAKHYHNIATVLPIRKRWILQSVISPAGARFRRRISSIRIQIVLLHSGNRLLGYLQAPIQVAPVAE